MSRCVFGLLLLCVVGTAFGKPTPADSSESRHYVSVGFDPFLLPTGLWGGVEIGVARDWSIGAQAGERWPSPRRQFHLYGGEITWYPVGSFDRGMQIVAHVLYSADSAYANGDLRAGPDGTTIGRQYAGLSQTLGMGIEIGYKYTFITGFFGNVKLGFFRFRNRTDFVDGWPSWGPDVSFGPWGYLNFGWSF